MGHREQTPFKLGVAQPGDSGVQFAPDGKRILFISGRTGADQIWLADFDSATGATTHLHKLTNLDLGVDNAKWSPDGHSVVFTAGVYPDCPAIVPDDNGAGAECNYDRDAKAADSKVKAQIFTQLLYRHWNHYTGEKRSHLFLISVDGSGMRDLNPGDVHDVPTDYPTDPIGCGCDISPDGKELAFTENVDAVPAVSTNSDIFTLDLTNPNAKPVKVSTSLGGDLSPAYSPDGKWLAWRSQARAGYESDRFRLMLDGSRQRDARETHYSRSETGVQRSDRRRVCTEVRTGWTDSRGLEFQHCSESNGEAPIFFVPGSATVLHESRTTN